MGSYNLKSYFITLSIVLYGYNASYVAKDYCNWNLCRGVRDTACNNTGQFASNCPPGVRLYKLSNAQKQIMLDSLNDCRSNVSLGSANNAAGDNFPMAAKMSKLMWDAEQEFMASLHIKTCGSHDPCKNTWFNASNYNFPVDAGQNLYIESTYAPTRPTMETTVRNAAYAWYNEIIVAPIDVVPSVHTISNGEIGHFLTIMHDKTCRVGCMASQWENTTDVYGVNKFTRVTCNIYGAPYLSKPLYETGDTCSGCPDTCDWDSDSPGLCVIDPNSFSNTYRF